LSRVYDERRKTEPVRLPPVPDVCPSGDHVVQFYSQAPFLIEQVSRFLGSALAAGDAAVAVVTKRHGTSLIEALTARGLNVASLIESGRFVILDAAETLSRFTIDGWPDKARFSEIVGGVLAPLVPISGHRKISVFGEMVALLWACGQRDAAICLEKFWNDLAREIRFSLLCAYPMSLFRRKTDAASFLRICEQHAHVVPAESYTRVAGRDQRLRAVSHLQQKALALETEAAVLQATEKSLAQQQRELADFFENAVEGLQRVGPDQRILWANKSLLDLLGYGANEYVGRYLPDFYVQPTVFEELWRRLMRREIIYDYPAKLRCKNGSIKHVLIHSNGCWNKGRFLYTRCFIRDVTEQDRLQEELKRRLDQLAEMDRRKDEFLAMLGHELRNPLAAVQYAINVSCLDASQQDRALDIARRQADQLGRLVDDLLDVARITQGTLRLRTQRLRFAQVVERALETTRPLVDQGKHYLTSLLPTDDVSVEADPTRLEQVIVNLIWNAVKYTASGGRIEVTVEPQGDEVVLRVRDNGIGIAPEMLPRVFELFARADGTLNRSPGGLGVGLTVARRIVELHGGHIAGSSDGLGRGAEFVVRLPLAPSMPDVADAAVAPAATYDRILLVEDNPDAAESLKMYLELLGHDVQVAADGFAALDSARASIPDVMLVDIGLPNMDGYEVARRVRQDPELTQVVLVALTGYGGKRDKEQAMAAGFDCHLVKPVSPEALREVLRCHGKPEANLPKPPRLGAPAELPGC